MRIWNKKTSQQRRGPNPKMGKLATRGCKILLLCGVKVMSVNRSFSAVFKMYILVTCLHRHIGKLFIIMWYVYKIYIWGIGEVVKAETWLELKDKIRFDKQDYSEISIFPYTCPAELVIFSILKFGLKEGSGRFSTAARCYLGTEWFHTIDLEFLSK